MSVSSPENIDPIDDQPGPSKSPEERQGPHRTRYGRAIVPKGDLPGEDQLPKNRKKKGKKEEPIRPKRKYTRRVPKEDSIEPIEEDMEEESVERETQEIQLDPDEYLVHPVPLIRNGQPSALPVPEPLYLPDFNKPVECQYCKTVVLSYQMEEHLLVKHKEHAQFECLSCKIRSFFNYWDLKAHIRECSNGRIGCPTDRNEQRSGKDVIEAPYFRRVYQAVECPFCKIYLDTFFDLEVHLNVHGLASMDAKFGCDGCRVTFTSIDSLKEHLYEKNHQFTSKCFNRGRVLNRREIEKLKERFEPEDRKDCMRKYNDLSYVLSAPKILEASQEAICAFCSKATRAYALIKTDLSNLEQYGLQCTSPEMEKDILERIQDTKCSIKKINAVGNRVSLCRNHFQWRNWRTKEEEDVLRRSKVAHQEELAQTLITRKELEAKAVENEDGIAILRDERLIGRSFMNDHSYLSNQQQPVIKLEDEDEGYERTNDDGNYEYDIIDLDDEEEEGTEGSSSRVVLPVIMNKGDLERKATAWLLTPYECPVCTLKYPNLNALHSHQTAHPYSSLTYKCADCPEKMFETPDEINQHFDEKMKSAVASFYSYKVEVVAEVHTNPKDTLKE
ncbi:hypothetical protein PFISCL1PPCAC_2203 [Pristionchus fissidentatus]|uniref:C2H2-type domain-containing protein n=1 Tax=Pristionchus fissidentatus TaxID=1538716 RepID=A0AAV5UUF0_9BILA|nr:hypothetical protein PFISCL1PPCAC_2203 [Pristionchus fissidentatus]